jgi:hypothetical protein
LEYKFFFLSFPKNELKLKNNQTETWFTNSSKLTITTSDNSIY